MDHQTKKGKKMDPKVLVELKRKMKKILSCTKLMIKNHVIKRYYMIKLKEEFSNKLEEKEKEEEELKEINFLLMEIKRSEDFRKKSRVLNFDIIFKIFEESLNDEKKKEICTIKNKSKKIEYFFEKFREFRDEKYPNEEKEFERQEKLADLSDPYRKYEANRKILKRKFFFHAGPTNSGISFQILRLKVEI
jgi:hypothetical protein